MKAKLNNRSFRTFIVLLAISPLIYFFGSGFYKLVRDFNGFTKPTNTYYEVFLPAKNETILPFKTYFSRINTPIAVYKIKDSRYKLMIFQVELSTDSFNPSTFYMHNDKQRLSEGGAFTGLDLWNATKSFYSLDSRPQINSIHVYLNPKFPIRELDKNNRFIHGKLNGDLLFSFNLEEKRFISIETTTDDFDTKPSPLEFLCFSKNQKHYIAVGVGNPPKGADDNYLKSLILEE